MSKSLGNAIGIHEPPQEMYGKLMSVSDEMMWRYYELLTDVPQADIGKMREQVARGEAHPMKLKQEMARMIVADFHSAEAARKAGEDWSRQFQKHETPDEGSIEQVQVSYAQIQAAAAAPGSALPFKVDKLIALAGLADSVADAGRKLKQKAVRINNQLVERPISTSPNGVPFEILLQVGRRFRRVLVKE
jgi:tyrosyl-tRNA synthetase